MYARVFAYFKVVWHYHILNVCLSVALMQDWCLILKLFLDFLNFIAALPFHLFFNYFQFSSFSRCIALPFSFVCLSFLISSLSFDFIHFQNNNSHYFFKISETIKHQVCLVLTSRRMRVWSVIVSIQTFLIQAHSEFQRQVWIECKTSAARLSTWVIYIYILII